MSLVEPKTIRCAVYTRKSSEDGLEQAFNSLHAQRAACEAYILSQTGEGWVAAPEGYDDGGISGGTMERPALQRLLAEVAAGRIQVVVVYKIDRLTRSLSDFARIVEVFERAGASFVSVTQAFNTTTSMGRLTLNVLLSFAQFEREVTGERIRDKIALSKAKGIWMGGVVPLGYDVCDRALVINPAEAEQVCQLYQRYLRLGSVHRLRDTLEREGVRSKAWVSRDGRTMGGAVIGRGALYHLLSNRLYLGEIVHRDQVHPGRHTAIVDLKLFDRVQKRLAAQSTRRRERPTAKTSSVLTGRLFDARGEPMSPTFSYGRGGKLYRYYVAADLQAGRTPPPDLVARVGADAVETVLVEQLRRLCDRPALDAEDMVELVQRVELRRNDTQLLLGAGALFGLDHPELGLEALARRLGAGERAVWEDGTCTVVRISLPVRMQLRGGRTTLSGVASQPQVRRDASLIQALRAAHADLAALNSAPTTAAPALHHGQAPATRHRRQLARLAFLAPDLQRMILDGRQPAALTLRLLLKSELPLAWEDQRAWFARLRLQHPAPNGLV
jgi:site-specific DNA recombinase